MVRKYLCLVISEFKELGFGVVPGKQTMVSIQEQRVTFLPPPWGVCDSGSDKSDYLFLSPLELELALYSNVSAASLSFELTLIS